MSKQEEWQSIIDRRLKPPKAFFDWCYRQIPTIRWENKNQVIETERQKGVRSTTVRLTKRSRLDFFDKFYSFGIVLVTSKRIEIQSYSFWSRYVAGKQCIRYELSNFQQLANNKQIALGCKYGQYSPGLVANFPSGGPYSGTVFFKNNWEGKVKTISELKYLEYPRGVFYTGLAHMYKYRSEIEFLQKINAWKLANDLAYDVTEYSGWHTRKAVDCRIITKKWLHKNKSFFRNSDRSFRDLEMELRIQERGGKMLPGVEKYLTYVDINKIPKAAKMNRFQNWIVKNNVDFQYYCDYLNLLSDLGIVPDTDNLIMPKDLIAAHDNAVKLFNHQQRESEQKAFSKRAKSLAKYEMVIGDYYFRAPINARELIQEGKALSHCVGGSNYVKQHSNGQTTIVFVRLANEIDKPLYTMEFRSDHIVQLRGKHNQNVPDEVWDVAQEWVNLITKRKNVA